MTRTAPTSRRTRTARALGLTLVAGAALVGTAGALPVDDDLPVLPPNSPPSATLVADPNPVVVPRPLQIAPGPALPALPVQQALPFKLGTLVSFSAVGSSDPDGSIVKYEWDVDGQPGFEKTTATPSTTLRHSTNTTIPVRVRVTDDDGATATATVSLVRHHAPIARATASVPVVLVGEGVTFDSAGSQDDGSIVQRQWDLDGDGTFERTGAQAATSFGAPGVHTATLRVTDNHGVARTGTVQVRVNERPTAAVTSTPLVPVAGAPVTLDASPSSDDTGVVRYEFDLDGDGVYERDNAGVPSVQTTFPATGPATVGLRVTDTDGATDTTALVLQVAAAPVVQADTAPSPMSPLLRRVKMAGNGRVGVRVACPAVEQTCRVNLKLVGLRAPVLNKRLGGLTRTLPGGRTATLSVKLGPKARKAVAKKPLRARAIITSTDQSGNRALTRAIITIRR